MNRYQIALHSFERIYPHERTDLNAADLNQPRTFRDSEIKQADLISLQRYIESIKPLPDYTVLLGICNDGLPLLLDLEEYSAGPILITGYQTMDYNRLLSSILTSAALINSTHQVRNFVISPNTCLYNSQNHGSFYQEIYSPNDRAASELIMELSALVEQRNTGRQRGPTIILAIDELDTLAQAMEEEVYSHFLWLLREGPFTKVWPIATLHAGSRMFSTYKFEVLFETRILADNDYQRSINFNNEDNSNFLWTPVFQVQSNRSQVNFALPIN